jgi:hypothetical protein
MEETSGGGAQPGAHRPPGREDAGQVFEVRVSGLVPDELAARLDPVEVVTHELRTSLLGHFADQAELHGFLARLRAFGLEVVEVRRRVDPAPPSAASPTGDEEGTAQQ